MNTAQEATSGPLINIKFLVVISMLCKTEWLWELQTWSHKTNLLDILSTSPHYFFRKWTLATNENSNFDLRSKGLKHDFFYKVLALVLLRVFGTWNRLLHVHPAWIVGSLRYSRTPLFRSPKGNGKSFEIAGFRNNRGSLKFVTMNHFLIKYSTVWRKTLIK